jgi:hypothetical protein
MKPSQRKVVLSALLRGTYCGAVLAAIVHLDCQVLPGRLAGLAPGSWAGRAESGWTWDQGLQFLVVGALAVGLASGIARLLAPSDWLVDTLSPDNGVARVGWRSRIGRWLVPRELGVTIFGIVLVGILAWGPLGCIGWLLWFGAGVGCVAYLLGLLHGLVAATWRRLRPSSSGAHIVDRSNELALSYTGLIAGPIVGYLLGKAVTLLPGASEWSLAPQYGIMLAVAGEIVLRAVRSPLMPCDVMRGAEAERPGESVTNPA